MGTILFLILAALEVTLCILTLTRRRDKRQHSRSRAVTAGAELLLAVLTMAFAGNGWRFAGCVILLILRLLIALVAWAVRRQADGSVKGFPVISGTVLRILLSAAALLPAFVITGYEGLPTTGAHPVAQVQGILIDRSRTEPRETDGSFREVPVHFYYPEDGAQDAPLVLFAHGSFGYYQSNSSAFCELASHGYTVVSIDHPYYAFFTKDTDGKVITVDTDFMQSAIDMTNGLYSDEETYALTQEWMALRTADENFVLDTIKETAATGALSDAWSTEDGEQITQLLSWTDTDNIGLTGHSIGGAVAVELGREREDVRAVIDIDGSMLGEYRGIADGQMQLCEEPYPVPLLALDSESHGESYADERYENRYLIDRAEDARELHFADTAHMDFTDLPLFSPFLASVFGRGTVEPRTFVPQLNAYILEFFDYYLKQEGTLGIPEGYTAVP